MIFRGRFLFASGGALCLAMTISACSPGTVRSTLPGPALPTFTQQNLPKGTTKLASDVYVIQYGSDFDAMPVSAARIYRNTSGLYVTNVMSGDEKIYPAATTVLRERNVSADVPNARIPLFVMGRCSGLDGSAYVSRMEDLRVPYGVPNLSGGGSGSNQGSITSSSADCKGGGAELDITFTVADTYPGDVIVTLCSTGNPCYYFGNIVPGSTHNVSIYSPAARSVYGVSMGIIFNGVSSLGVGGASIPGCSSD